jgi:hypothetical protein
MRKLLVPACLAALGLAGPAAAYEYPLQPADSHATRTFIAGYAYKNGKVAGDCSYEIVSGGGGRGSHSVTTNFYQHCTWDLHGVLSTIAAGKPTAPTPLSTTNGLTIYARNATGGFTGVDTAHGNLGFVNTPSAQFTWLTASGGVVFAASQKAFPVTLSIQNVGELPLVVNKISPTALYAKASLKSTTCAPTAVPPGHSCTIVVTYNPGVIPGGDDPYTAYDRLSVTITSNSGQATAFGETIEVPIAPAG